MWCTPERARIIVVIVCISAAILTFPEFFEYRTLRETHSETNATSLTVGVTGFGKADSYQWGYIYTNQALFTFIPLICLSIFNFLLIRAVLKAAKQRKAMSKVTVTIQSDRSERQRREQHKITVMLILVVIVFLICQVPQAVQNLYMTYLDVTGKMGLADRLKAAITGNVFNLLVMINSSLNFILYSSFSMRFRRTFHRLFCRCLQSRFPSDLFSDAYADGSKTNLVLHGTTCTNVSRSPRASAADIYNATQHRLSSSGLGQGQGQVQHRQSIVTLNSDKHRPTQYTTKNGYLDVSSAQGNTSVV